MTADERFIRFERDSGRRESDLMPQRKTRSSVVTRDRDKTRSLVPNCQIGDLGGVGLGNTRLKLRKFLEQFHLERGEVSICYGLT